MKLISYRSTWSTVQDPHFGTPQILSNFIFPLYLFTLQILSFQLKRLKNLSFGGPVWGYASPPIFVRFGLFYLPFRRFNPSSSNSLKIQNFGEPRLRKIPKVVLPISGGY